MALNRTASVWGSYFGELIREELGGTWVTEESKRKLTILNINYSPIDYVNRRITGQTDVSVKQCLMN